jgi:7-cyano-7-deazaguanine synthase in queuosine biosynthesis
MVYISSSFPANDLFKISFSSSLFISNNNHLDRLSVATGKGVALSKHKWDRLCDTMQVMREFVPELDQACSCYYSHQNELESISCKECSPCEEMHLHLNAWCIFRPLSLLTTSLKYRSVHPFSSLTTTI